MTPITNHEFYSNPVFTAYCLYCGKHNQDSIHKPENDSKLQETEPKLGDESRYYAHVFQEIPGTGICVCGVARAKGLHIQEPLPEWKAGAVVEKPIPPGSQHFFKWNSDSYESPSCEICGGPYESHMARPIMDGLTPAITPTTTTLTASLRRTNSSFQFLILTLGEECVSIILTPREYEQLVELGLEVMG